MYTLKHTKASPYTIVSSDTIFLKEIISIETIHIMRDDESSWWYQSTKLEYTVDRSHTKLYSTMGRIWGMCLKIAGMVGCAILNF